MDQNQKAPTDPRGVISDGLNVAAKMMSTSNNPTIKTAAVVAEAAAIAVKYAPDMPETDLKEANAFLDGQERIHPC